MCIAVRALRSGEMGYLRASKYFSVPTGTQERYLKDASRSPEDPVNVHLGRITVLLLSMSTNLWRTA
jgi:hypothetical protein